MNSINIIWECPDCHNEDTVLMDVEVYPVLLPDHGYIFLGNDVPVMCFNCGWGTPDE